MRSKILLPFLLLILSALSSTAQKHNRFWYFGSHAGLNFATTPPTPLSDGSLDAFEGCAAISDTGGNLLFYTDGEIIWSKNHFPMPTGTGLSGGGATEGSIVVPKPLSFTEFYVFTVDTNGGPRGLRYNLVDMTLNGGMGDVTIKNSQLVTPVAEKLTAIRHQNKRDAWVLVHEWNSLNYVAYLVNPSGISSSPVTSTGGVLQGGVFSNAHGYLKGSPDGKKVAAAIRNLRTVEILDFDNSTGQVSNSISLTFSKEVYGLEFSPDSRFLYVSQYSSTSDITQFDLTAGSASAITASAIVVGTYTGHFFGAMQLGPDDKIYGTAHQSTSLAVIDQPNNKGMLCGFNASAQPLALLTSAKYGLPNFLKNMYVVADFTYADTCFGLPTNFSVSTLGIDSVKWNFDDLSTGASNSSTSLNPAHTFSSAAQFDVELIVFTGALSDTITKTINIVAPPDPELGLDQAGCTGASFTFYPGLFPAGTKYLWNDGSTLDNYTATVTDTVWVQLELNGCYGSDSVKVLITNPPVVNFGTVPTTICGNDSVKLDATTANATYEWQDGSTNPVFYAKATGNYGVYVKVNGCIGGDTTFITVTSAPVVSLGNDTTICKGFQLFYDVNNLDPNSTYLWQDGSTNSFFFVSDSGNYKVTITNGTCTASDSVHIDLQEKPIIFLGEDTVACAGQQIELSAYTYGGIYQWQDGSDESFYAPRISGKYSVTVTNQCGVGADTVEVTLLLCNCNVFIPNTFTPNSDTKNDIFNYKYSCTNFTAELSVYNRIGQLIFKTDNPDFGWDGTYLGKKATEGVYIYQVKYRGYDEFKYVNETLRGTFALIR